MGGDKVIFEKNNKLLAFYLQKNVSKEDVVEFQTCFEVIFSSFRDEIEDEVGIENYEVLDEMYLIFDAYEPDQNIRSYDNHCLDEQTVMSKIREMYKKLDIAKFPKNKSL